MTTASLRTSGLQTFGLTCLLALLLSATSPANAFLDSLRGSNPMTDVLPPDEAMQVSAETDVAGQQILMTFVLAPDVYLYRHMLGFTLYDTSGNQLENFADFELPTGEDKTDEIYGDVEVFREVFELALPLTSIPLTETLLEVRYQGCLEDILCYSPQVKQLPLTFVNASFADGATITTETADSENGFFNTLRSQDAGRYSGWLGEQRLSMVLLLFFVGGLLLAFTPCVFPMVPILSGIIAGQEHPTAMRGFFLSTAYVLGMAIPYTLAGLLVALFGAGMNLQVWLQQPVAILISSTIFVLLALAMFGLFTLQMPAWLRNRTQQQRQGGSLAGAALMGAISALVVSPCVTPILAGALMYVAATGDATLGTLTLFALAMGMGAPLIAWGTGGSHLLPRAGQWMDDIRHFFGVILLGVAIWLLDRLVHDSLTLALYGMLLAVYGVHLGALEPASDQTSRLKRGIALVLTLYGAVMVIGAASGGTDPLQPLQASQSASTHADGTTTGTSESLAPDEKGFINVKGEKRLAALLQTAKAEQQPVMVDFFAEWCVACKVLEETTLSDLRVLTAMNDKQMLLIRADITDINQENRAIMASYDIFGLPSLVFFDPQGQEIADSRVLGEMSAERFLNHLETRVFPGF